MAYENSFKEVHNRSKLLYEVKNSATVIMKIMITYIYIVKSLEKVVEECESPTPLKVNSNSNIIVIPIMIFL